MEIFRFNILSTEEIERREALKAALQQCPHCGDTLHFQVRKDLVQNQVQEDSHCSSCAIAIRTDWHPLQ